MIPGLETIVGTFFPKSKLGDDVFWKSADGQRLGHLLSQLSSIPLRVTRFNQLLHLCHEAGVTPGFFKYYFLSVPQDHPYDVTKVVASLPPIGANGISSLEQLDWGMRRFFVDALLYFGDLRTAYRDLRRRSYDDLTQQFAHRRVSLPADNSREDTLPFVSIPPDDRHLIGEIAARAYLVREGPLNVVEAIARDEYRQRGVSRISLPDLLAKESRRTKVTEVQQMMIDYVKDDYTADDYVSSEEDIERKIHSVVARFESARQKALINTRLYLSAVNELDVYVATSMRGRADFRQMAKDCAAIFSSERLKPLKLRYFDPTLSAADVPEDKGLIECLMVKCAKALLYFAGDKDSFGKDAEAAMALSLGRPVVILCPPDEKGSNRMDVFKNVHPLSRLIQFDTGVACGAMVTQKVEEATELLWRIFRNQMEYELVDAPYYRLRERLTGSVVRLQTSDKLIRETFWNYYHGEGRSNAADLT